METGISLIPLSSDADNATQFRRIRAAGAKYVEIRIYWSVVAPSRSTKPAGFQPKDPADRKYKWTYYDKQ